jgi:formyltetrahydrofolate deformylase
MKYTAVLLVDCPDRKGLVARVAGLLYEHGVNILHADQHQDHDLGLFFMRVEWTLSANGSAGGTEHESGFDLVAFTRAFTPIAADLEMRWQVAVMNAPTRVALFCSQYLHCAADLLHSWQARELDCDIRVVVSNHRDVEKLARYYGIPFEYVPVSAATRAEAEARQIAILEEHGI